VGVLDGLTDFQEQAKNLIARKMFGELVDGRAFHEFQRDVGEAVVVGAAIDQTGDVGMLQAGQKLALLLETAEGELAVQAIADDFHGDALVEIVVANGLVDVAHAALPQLTDDAVVAEGGTGVELAEVERPGVGGGTKNASNRRLQGSLRAGGVREQ
jgi:hypothetical protein